jgi:hypothetical protein
MVFAALRGDCGRRGPIGTALFTDALIAMLLTERYVAGRSMNSLVTELW